MGKLWALQMKGCFGREETSIYADSLLISQPRVELTFDLNSYHVRWHKYIEAGENTRESFFINNNSKSPGVPEGQWKGLRSPQTILEKDHVFHVFQKSLLLPYLLYNHPQGGLSIAYIEDS